MRTLLAVMLAFGLLSSSHAQNWTGMLKNTPGEAFNDEDKRLFRETGRKALAEAPDGEVRSWQNPKTGHRGDVTVLRSFEWQAHPCKQVRLRNEAQGRKGDSSLNLCKVNDRWRLVSDAQLKKK